MLRRARPSKLALSVVAKNEWSFSTDAKERSSEVVFSAETHCVKPDAACAEARCSFLTAMAVSPLLKRARAKVHNRKVFRQCAPRLELLKGRFQLLDGVLLARLVVVCKGEHCLQATAKSIVGMGFTQVLVEEPKTENVSAGNGQDKTRLAGAHPPEQITQMLNVDSEYCLRVL
jgi:hypothetical protein